MAAISPVSTNNVQTCPHGAPFGACPVCSGMGGGGVKQKKAEPPKNEMSYAECYAVWMRMKAADRHKLEAENNIQRQAAILQNMRASLSTMFNKLMAVLNKMENILPSPVNKVFSGIINNILKPIVSIIQNFPAFVENVAKFMQNIQREIYIASEKLASVFGEIKNFIQKKLSETFKKFTKKVYKILNIFGFFTGDDDDFSEDEKVSAELAAFKAKDIVSIKEFLINLTKQRKNDHDDSLDAN